MEAESIHVGVTGVLSAFTAVMGFFGIRLVKQVDMNTKEISDHRIEDAGKYATNADVRDSLSRVHDRIDDMDKKQDRMLEILLAQKHDR